MFLYVLDGELIVIAHFLEDDWELVIHLTIARQQIIVGVVGNDDGIVWGPMITFDDILHFFLALRVHLKL